MIHSSIGMTPANAVKEEKWVKAKESMLKQAKFTRVDNEIKVGDKVKIFKKRMCNDGLKIALLLRE